MPLTIQKIFGTKSEIVLVIFLVSILVVLFTPIPAVLLDFLLIMNFSFGLLVLLLTLYTDRPLSFSTFPTLLLIATLFRLSLNIAATRLILADGDAGEVIGAVGTYVVGGNYVIGLVVFLILIVVQYIVVTNGAQRVAEVAARFTLDSMPGKQMSIDADLNMGLIEESEAQTRRKDVEREASFYGAMDGASKFVKGDAIAGIIIILIDIIGGLIIGIAQNGMSWGDALHTYTLLTVGDGIVTQIPALVISTATGIIVTRAATDAKFGEEVSSQLAKYPSTLVMVALGLLIVLFVPGIPKLPIAIMFFVISLGAFFAFRRGEEPEAAGDGDGEDSGSLDEDLYEKLSVDPIEVAVGKEAIAALGAGKALVKEKIMLFREQFANDMGFVIPGVRIREDESIDAHSYQVRLHGARVASGQLYPGREMAIASSELLSGLSGIQTKEPTYGLPAVWLSEEDSRNLGRNITLVDPITVLITHFSEVVRRHSEDLLTRQETEELLNRVKTAHASLYEELIPNMLSLSDIQKVLHCLLKENVSTRNIVKIAEVLLDHSRTTKAPEELAEAVRRSLGRNICEGLMGEADELSVLTLDPVVEQVLQRGLRQLENTVAFSVDPKVLEKLIKALAEESEKMMAKGIKPVLLCSAGIRRHIKQSVERILAHLAIISMSEVPSTINIASFGVVRLDAKLLEQSRGLRSIPPAVNRGEPVHD